MRTKLLLFLIPFLLGIAFVVLQAQVPNTHNLVGIQREVASPTSGSYGKVLKYNPTTGRWTAQDDSLGAFANPDSIAVGYIRAKNDTLYIYDKDGYLLQQITTNSTDIPNGLLSASYYDSTETADGTRYYSFVVTDAKDPAAAGEVTGIYGAVNKQNGSNGVYTFNAIEGVARSSYADEAGTFRGVYGRTYTSPGATASMRTAVGGEFSARAGYSGGTDCVAEAGTGFIGARVWMAPYFTGASLANMTNFWGLWIYGEHTTQINGDAAIKIGTAGGKFTVDLNLQNGETISNNTDGTVAVSGIISDGSSNTSTQWTAAHTRVAADSSNWNTAYINNHAAATHDSSKVTNGGLSGADLQDPLMGLDLWNLVKAPGDSSGVGNYIIATAGERLERGDVVRVHSDGKFYRADADSAITMPVAYLALTAGAAESALQFLRSGVFRYDSRFAFTVGGIVYASVTTGTMSTTAPVATGDQVQPIGVALSADVIDFRPDLTLVEVP